MDEKEAKGKHDDPVYFFSEKLDLNIDVARDLLGKHPEMYKHKLRRVSKIIDYLLNEADYTVDDIIDCPRILRFSLKTIIERIETTNCKTGKKIRLSLIAQGSVRFKKTLHFGKKISD